MRKEEVEIYSDFPNAAVLRHPGRRFPGVLLQGDTLYTFCVELDAACTASKGCIDDESYASLNDLRNRIWSLLSGYKQVLAEHDLPLPFSEQPAR